MTAAAAPTAPLAPLGRLGSYRLLRLIGEGAAGQVFLASQDNPAREVAIKVLRAASPVGRQRFERELELLAGLEHSNIARLYDCGSEAGPTGDTPYLVMEYVRGRDLLSHARGLDLAGRLRLLAELARAVHFAHTRGVIHRDLKPGNILVNEHGEPKILDFGIAHVVSDDATQMTASGEVLGTLSYMSWEQLAGEGIDARADVYALGAVGYQMLCGELPYPDLAQDTLIGAVARLQRESPVQLASRLPAARGDLETIIMKALARDREQRYASAAEFAADIERCLRQQPIEARPPTLGYVLGLFVRRHKALTAAALLALFSLAGAAVLSFSYALSESRAHAAAEARLAERQAVTGFLTRMLTSADPSQSLGKKLTVLEVLDAARGQLDQSLPAPVLSQLQDALGRTYVALGDAEQGLALLQAARDISVARHGPAAAESIAAEQEVIHALMQGGREREALAAIEALQARQPAGDRAAWFTTRFYHGRLLTQIGEFEQADALLQPALDEARGELGLHHPVTINLVNERARVLQRLTRFDEAMALAREVLAALDTAGGPAHGSSLETQEILALALRESGEYEASLPLFRQIRDARLAILGPEHPDTNVSTLNMAATLALAGRAQEGLPLVIEAHEKLLQRLGAGAALVLNAVSLRAYVASEAGDLDKAAAAYRELIDQARLTPDGLNESFLPDFNNLGNVQRRLGRLQDADATFRELMQLSLQMQGDDHPHYGLFESNYGETLRRLGRFSEARQRLEHALAVNRETLGAEHPSTRRTEQRLAQVLAGDSSG